MQAGNSLLQSSFPLMRGLYTEKGVSKQVKTVPQTCPHTNQCLFNKHVLVVSICKSHVLVVLHPNSVL